MVVFLVTAAATAEEHHFYDMAQNRARLFSNGGNGEPFVHVFDEQSFFLVLRNLDTIIDLVGYLAAKEQFLKRAAVVLEGGEENLLATYIHAGRQFPGNTDFIVLHDDICDGVSTKPEFLAKLDRDQDSYVWDRLLESFCAGGFEGDSWRGPSMAEAEQALRVLAKEDRFARRSLGAALREFLESSKAGKVRSRIVCPQLGVTYIFLAYSAELDLDQRRAELTARCFASLCQFAGSSTVIGIGMNVPGERPNGGYSSELVMLHTSDNTWPEEFLEQGRIARDTLGYFKAPVISHRHDDEYPNPVEKPKKNISPKKSRERNRKPKMR